MNKCLLAIVSGSLLLFTACDKANHERAALSQSAATNTNLTISVNVPKIDMTQTKGALTNAAEDIKEAAGAAVAEARRLGDRMRESLRSDPVLSKDAQRITITVDETRVTLRGIVNSESEKQAVEDKVRGLAGDKSIDNQLKIKSE
jgi:hypothetical protein